MVGARGLSTYGTGAGRLRSGRVPGRTAEERGCDCARYRRRLMAAGKRQTLITTAIAREMAAFLWAIGQEV
jgi:hypothetical protein